MTEIQLIHHQEQMDAARAEFEELWKFKLLPKSREMGFKTPRELCWIEHLTWMAYCDKMRKGK